MIYSTLRDQDRSFWCRGWWKHKTQYFFRWNEAVEVIEATEAVEAAEVIETTDILRPGKSLLSTPESSRLLNLDLFWCFENHFFWWNHEISFFNSCTFSVGGCWGQPKLHFWKLVLIIKMSTSQHFKTTFKYNLTCIFLSLRAKLKKPLCPRTPCTYSKSI